MWLSWPTPYPGRPPPARWPRLWRCLSRPRPAVFPD